MKVSLNAIRKVNQLYGSAGDPAPDGSGALIEKIGAQLAGIDEIIRYGERFEGILVAKVVSYEDHPNAERLHVCKIDDGEKTKGVERDENGYVQVVCGAPNVRVDLVVAWLPPGSIVPNTRGREQFTLEARTIRGVVSNGMLASPRELTIGDNHDGIIELDTNAVSGTPFAEAYDLVGDIVLDMENKMFTHRPDCFGQIGIARELEGIQHRPYKSPQWYRPEPEFPSLEADELKLEVQNELPNLLPRFTAITMRGVTVKPSPIWLQIALSRVGIRPINNIVDYTNFFMHETGQPLHAYDYDKVVAQDAGAQQATIVIRYPKPGEKVTLLNGKLLEPHQEAIMIATRDKLIGVGGVMGGSDTEVDEHTRNIILECASFDMYSIRRTSMTHGLFTDAVTRFNKGQSPLQSTAVLAKIVDEIRRFAEGKVAGKVIDDVHLAPEVLAGKTMHPPVSISSDFINARLGIKLSAQEMAALLVNVEFEVTVHDSQLTVQAPFWRTDIAIPEDVAEEIGRLHGYDHLPLELPARTLIPAPKNPILTLKARIRDRLAAAGANEVLTYSFVHGNLLQKAGQNPRQAFQLSNALSPDLQYYRVSLLPSLLEKVHPNIKAGHEQFALFEIGRAHNQTAIGSAEPGLPRTSNRLSLVYASKHSQSGAAYYRAKQFLLQVLETAHDGCSVVNWQALSPFAQAALQGKNEELADYAALMAPFAQERSGFVADKADPEGLPIAIVGEFRPAIKHALKLPDYSAGFEVFIDDLARDPRPSYIRLPRFPKVEQDICLKVPASTTYAQVFDFVQSILQAAKPERTLMKLAPLDIYQRPDDLEHKQFTLRFSLASYERTLTDAEVAKLLDKVAMAAQQSLQADRV